MLLHRLICYYILLHRLQFTFGVTGKVFSWFSSYLSGRSQQIAINDTLSAEFELHCGVPQGSCLGPLLFTLCSSKLFEIIKHHFPTVHCYADDTQVYISLCPNDSLDQLNAAELLESCIDDIRAWMLHDNLKLNGEKTELLIIGTPQQLDKVVITHISAKVIPTFTLCLSLGTLARGSMPISL